jgi:hypothetical protein
LAAVSKEKLLISSEYYGKPYISSCFIKAIQTPFELSSRIRRAESEGENFIAITSGRISLN